MSRLGFKTIVYHGEVCLGEVDTIPVKDGNFKFPNNEIRIHRISPNSERCHPLAVLQTISSSVLCKLEPPNSSTTTTSTAAVASAAVDQSQLTNLHACCFYELKTAVVLLGDEEVHLVAMPSKLKKFPCFWCYSVPCGLYEECLGMLNLRCLAIVFDLDETLIVANTMKSFEDRIEALRGWIQRETDPVRISGMSAEMKRYVEDRALLKQYAENDCVVDGGRVYTVQQEDVTPLSDGHERVVRPIIRLPEKNVVLTRINPEIRDTSVLVRLRPAWEDLRSYLTAKGRRRFQVYVCTMAERDYALEMWRLLDPEAHLISSKQLPERVVCVKSGARKSLLNVFQDRNCHPTMAMVIDDRSKVWEDIDQPRVHVVPAFTPYYAPQAETASAVPVLCVARNVACNVRGGFFRDFDENLLRKISEVFYEDEVVNVPSSPDVSNYLISEDISFAQNGNSHPPIAEGMNGPEVGQRINQLDEKSILCSTGHPMNNGIELKAGTTQPSIATLPNMAGVPSLKAVPPSDKPSLLGDPFKRDINFSEADPDMKRRLLMMNRGQDVKYPGSVEPPILPRVPGLLPALPLQSQGGWLVEEDIKDSGLSTGMLQEFDAPRPDKQQVSQNTRRTDVGPSPHQLSTNSSKDQPEGGKVAFLPSLCISVLQEIGRRCHSKVEFRPVVGTSADLQFSVEVYFTGEKIGVGMGKTRKDAQQQAAENALRSLADKYMSHVAPRSRAVDRDVEKPSIDNENGFVWDLANPRSDEDSADNGLPKGSTSEVAEVATAGTSSNPLHQKVEYHANSPRMGQFSPNKRLREDLPHDSNKRLREELPHDSQGL